MKPPFPAKGQSVKWPYLERNSYLAIFGVILIVTALLLFGCGGGGDSPKPPGPRPTPTATPRPTSTPRPTATPRPSITPRPTATPKPSPTATPRLTPTPVTQRDVAVAWTYTRGLVSRIRYVKVCWALDGIETCKNAGKATSTIIPKLKIGSRYRIVIIPMLEPGLYGDGQLREHFLDEQSCLVTATGCAP